ncbi:MAG TPA: hypothetical protein PKZ97_04090 [Azospirillaceae bacterium]|nr:hypothetical protein [Azospirillaceae bacterium]HRQ80277.1 hypothetical protein [Azospirillaceae bacterium]
MTSGLPPTASARIGEHSPHRQPPHFSVLGLSVVARLGVATTLIVALWLAVAWALDWLS